MTRPVFGLVLAGGESRRMGRDKATLQRDGKSQLAYLAELLEQHVERVFVSTRADQANEPERARFEQIVDSVDTGGPLAGILSAIAAYPAVDWLVVACDLPNIDETTIEYLLQNRATMQPFTAFESSHDSLPEPLCAVYHVGSGEIVRDFVEDGINCPRKIMIRSDTLLLQQPDPRALDNVNTPDDLRDSILQAS
ncbi:MAG: molybdenum cofactor guanylyltransferase [Pseudomonadota bacterium]